MCEPVYRLSGDRLATYCFKPGAVDKGYAGDPSSIPIQFRSRLPLLLAELAQIDDESFDFAVLEGLSPRRHIARQIHRHAALLDRLEHDVVGDFRHRRAIAEIAWPGLQR